MNPSLTERTIRWDVSSDKSKGVGEESLLLAALSTGKAPNPYGRARDNMRTQTAWEVRGRGTHAGEEFAQRLSELNACVVVGMKTVTHRLGSEHLVPDR